MLGFVPSLLCRGVCVDRGVVYSPCWVVIPQWRSLCGRSCVDIVEILLCEGGDVEWLEPRNISWCLRLIHYFSTLSLFISCIVITCSYSYTKYSLCAHLCSTKRAFNSTSTFSPEEFRVVVSELFTGNSGSLLVTYSVLAIKF